MLTLYFSPGASSMATHIALHEVGAPFETRLVSLAKKENLKPEFLAINPEGKVPTLVIDGRPLTEVAANLWYLAKRFPQAELLPQNDLLAEAEVLSWMSFIRRAASASSAGRRSLAWLIGGSPGAIGRSGVIRSPISICSASIGASIGRPIRHRPTTPASPRTTSG